MKLNSDKIKFIIILILVIIFYGNTVKNGYNLDDNYILEGIPANIENFSDCFKVFKQRFDGVSYRPIGVFTVALEKWILKENNPTVSHGINLLLFFIGVLILYIVLNSLKIPHIDKIGFITVVLFIAHPIHANVVNSIKNRDILLSFIFSFLSLFAFIKFLDKKILHTRIMFFILSSIFLLIALISKQDAYWVLLVVPFLLFEKSGNLKASKLIISVLGITFLFFIISTFLQNIFISQLPAAVENAGTKIIFTENPIVNANFAGKIYYVVVTVFMYIKFLLIPIGYYFYFGQKAIPEPHLLQPYFILGLFFIITILFYLFKNYKNKNGILYPFLFMIISILYCLNIVVPVAGIADPRLAFHASAGFCLLLAMGIYYLSENEKVKSIFQSLPLQKIQNALLLLVTATIILIYLPITLSRNADWQNIYTLLDSDMPHLGNSFQANRIASFHYLNAAKAATDNTVRNNMILKGLQASENAIKIDPENISTQEGKGIAYFLLNQRDSALSQFKFVTQKFDSSEVAWEMMGDIYYNSKKKDSANWCFKNTTRVSPKYDRPYYKYSTSMAETGNQDSAIIFYKEKIKADPQWFVLYDNIGYLYLTKNDTLQASKYYADAFKFGLKDMNLYKSLDSYLTRKNETETLAKVKSAYKKGQFN